MAQLAVGLAGAALGNFALPGGVAALGLTGGAIGFTVATTAYALATQQNIHNRQPVIDGEVTSSAYGKILPRVWGIYPVAGNIIDASEIRKISTTTESGGKGGPTVSNTTHQYFADLAVAVHDGEIAGILQIRANGRVIYDASSSASVVKPEWLKFSLYPGTETQEPDPTFEAIHGAGEVPAYRGAAYVVFEDFALSEFGVSEQITVTFEFLIAVAATSGTTLQTTQIAATGEPSGYAGGIVETSTGLIVFALDDDTATYSAAAVDPYTREVVWQTAYTGSSPGDWIGPSLKPKIVVTPTATYAVPGELVFRTGQYLVRVDAQSGTILEYSDQKCTGTAYITDLAVDWYDTNPLSAVYCITTNGAFNGFNLVRGFDTSEELSPPDGYFIGPQLVSDGEGKLLVELWDLIVSPTQISVAVYDADLEAWGTPADVDGFSTGVRVDGNWWIVTGSDTLAEVDDDGSVLTTVDLSADYSLSVTISTGASASVTDGLLYDVSTHSLLFQASGSLYRLALNDLTQAPTAAVTGGGFLSAFHTETCRAWYGPNSSVNASSANICALTGQSATLDDVVSDLATDGTELASGDIDVTALASTTVRGFGVITSMARRNALTMLQAAFLFDMVPRSGKLTAILRGQSSSATLTEDEIGAYIDGGSAPAPWTIRRAAGNTLPSQVEVSFIDPDHNYERNTQIARHQGHTSGTTDSVEIAVVLSNDEAAQLAETFLHLRHIEAESYETTTMPSTVDDAQPAKVLTTTHDGESYVYRVTDGSIIDGRMIALRAAREVAEVFTGYAVGGSPRTAGGSVRVLGNTVVYPLDIPLLRERDNNAGVYIGAASFTPAWPGADVQRSTDGLSYSTVTTLTSAAVLGNVINAPTTGEPHRLDLTTELQVRLVSGLLSSGTRAAPTYFAWGENGRYEIGSFITATQHADGYWQVTQIVRGLFGSEHAMDGHAAGDRFIVLDADTLGRAIYSASSIGATEYLRGITIGRQQSTGIPERFTFTAEALEPYAPCRLHAEKDGSSNWDLSWVRRDRVPTRALWAPANSEAEEKYTVEILDDLGDALRTETVTDATAFEYTTAMQSTDFGGNIDQIYWRVAQVSAYTGNGHFATAQSGAAYNYVSAVVGKSPALYTRFEEASGTTASPTVGSIDGTYVGSPTLGVGGLLPTGTAITLNGSGQYVEWLIDGSDVDWVQGFEIAFNINAFPVSGADVICAHAPTSVLASCIHVIIRSDQKIQVVARKSGGTIVADVTGSATLSTSTPYHLIVNFGYGSSSALDVYLNGASYASTTNSQSWQLLTTSFGRLHVGHSDVGGYGDFDGTIDDFVCYPDNLTSGELADQFARGGIA